MGMRAGALRLAALAAVTLVGTGACALGPARQPAGSEELRPAAAAQGESGASASPGPDQSAGQSSVPSPASTPTAGPTPATGPSTTSPAKPSGCPRGTYQRQVERYLNELGGYGTLTVDGAQSATDCQAIKKFQRRFGISPATGKAGPTTLSVAKRLATTDTSKCHAGTGLTICVDLTLQTVWAVRGGDVVFGPTVTRTGMSGYRTPAGSYRIGWRNRSEWSNPYKVWLPYWQQFHGGMGFHETTTYLHESANGSHGCVNLLHGDAQALWKLGRVGTKVHVFGRRAGT